MRFVCNNFTKIVRFKLLISKYIQTCNIIFFFLCFLYYFMIIFIIYNKLNMFTCNED